MRCEVWVNFTASTAGRAWIIVLDAGSIGPSERDRLFRSGISDRFCHCDLRDALPSAVLPRYATYALHFLLFSFFSAFYASYAFYAFYAKHRDGSGAVGGSLCQSTIDIDTTLILGVVISTFHAFMRSIEGKLGF